MDDIRVRVDTELRLMQLCERYEQMIRRAYEERHDQPPGPQTVHLHDLLNWSMDAGLVTEDEDRIWRDAMVLRNTMLQQRLFRIVLEDIERHLQLLAPIVQVLPARIHALPSNLGFLR